MEQQDSKVRVIVSIALIALVIIGAVVQRQLDKLQDANLFYRWLQSVQTMQQSEFLVSVLDRNSDEWRLYERIRNSSPEFSKMDINALWHQVAYASSTADVRADFKRYLREDKITAIEPGKYYYSSELGNLTGLIFGFRHIVADLLWLQTHEAWHRGEVGRLISYYYLVVAFDPQFIEAYRIGSWHLSYNVATAFPQNANYYIDQGLRFVEKGIRNNPNDWNLYFELGYVQYYNKLNEPAKAIAPMEKAASLPGHSSWVERGLMHVYRDARQYDKAIAGWAQFKQRYPDAQDDVPDRLILTIRAEQAFDEAEKTQDDQSIDRARQLYREFKEKYPGLALDADTSLAMLDLIAMEKQGKLQEAYDAWEKLWEQNKIILPNAEAARERIKQKLQQSAAGKA